jgi:hypothetical protein
MVAPAVAATRAGLMSVSVYRPEAGIALPEPARDLPIAIPPPAMAIPPAEEAVARVTLFDDLMLGVLIVGLVACAVFVWINLPRFLATG